MEKSEGTTLRSRKQQHLLEDEKMKRSTNYALWSNDVEMTSIWLNTLKEKTGEKVLREGMPVLIDLYKKYGITSTFYYTWHIAKKFPEVVRLAVEAGHEIGSHGKSHLRENGFDVMTFKRQKRHLEESKKLLEDLSGTEVINFRAPALRVNQDTSRALVETGYKIDSSIASQRFDFFLSFGGKKKLSWLSAPRLPYRTRPDNLYRKGDGPLVEVPLSATFMPYLGTTMRIFPKLTDIQRSILHFETRLNKKPVVFLIHPNEFIDESDEERVITRRTKNPIAFFLQDWLRSKLKVKNLGPPAIPLFERQIGYFSEKGYQGVSIRQFCEQQGFL